MAGVWSVVIVDNQVYQRPDSQREEMGRGSATCGGSAQKREAPHPVHIFVKRIERECEGRVCGRGDRVDGLVVRSNPGIDRPSAN